MIYVSQVFKNNLYVVVSYLSLYSEGETDWNQTLLNMDIDKLIYDCIGASMQVYNHLGPGLLETIYEKALTYELTERGFKVNTQVNIDIKYKGVVLDTDLRLDLIVEDTLIIELKSVEKLAPVHFKQLRTYMKLLDKPAALLINFNVADFNTGFKVLKRENTCDTLGQ